MRSPYKGFAATGAFLEMEPDDRQARLGFEGFRDLGYATRFQTHESSHGRTKLNEITAGNTLTPEFFINI